MNKQEISSLPFFFIIGRPRSGTTLLEALFDAHPNVSIPVECPYIINLHKHYQKITHWDEKTLMTFYEELIVQSRFNTWIVDKEKLKQDLLNCKGETTFQTICRVVHLNYQSLYEKKEIKFIGDKNPIYSIYTKDLMRLFPDAKFIYINRDYRDNAVSIIKAGSVLRAAFDKPFVPIIVHQWKHFYKIFRKKKNKFPEKFLYLKYEDLVNDPKKYTQEVCSFLGIEFIPEVLDFYKKKEEFSKQYSTGFNKIYKNLFKPIGPERIRTWENELTKRQVKMADMIVGKQLAKELGYERMYKKFNLFLYILMLPFIWYAKCSNFIAFVTDKLPHKLKLKAKRRINY